LLLLDLLVFLTLLALLVLHPAITHAEAAKINPRKPSTTSLKVVAVAAAMVVAIDLLAINLLCLTLKTI
jgi:hypothetical protein